MCQNECKHNNTQRPSQKPFWITLGARSDEKMEGGELGGRETKTYIHTRAIPWVLKE